MVQLAAPMSRKSFHFTNNYVEQLRRYNACLTQSNGLPMSVQTWLRTVDEASKSNVIK